MANIFNKKKSIFKNPAFLTSLVVIPSAAIIYFFGGSRIKNLNFPGTGSENLDDNSERTNYGDSQIKAVNDAAKKAGKAESIDFNEADFEETNEEKDYGTCQAISTRGTQCKRKAVDESGYCWQHKKIVEQEA